jgi:hypothetical protein
VAWVQTLGPDASLTIPDVFTDPRVRHFRDQDKIAGEWFAALNGNPGMTYDLYYVFGPEARWEDAPAPMRLAGATVITDTAEIEAALASALGE